MPDTPLNPTPSDPSGRKPLTREQEEVLQAIRPGDTILGRTRGQKKPDESWGHTVRALPSRRSVMMKVISSSGDTESPASLPTESGPAVGTAAMTPPPQAAMTDPTLEFGAFDEPEARGEVNEAEAETGLLPAFPPEEGEDLDLPPAQAAAALDKDGPVATADAMQTLDLADIPTRQGRPTDTIDPQRKTTIKRGAHQRGPLGSNAAKRTVSIRPGATLSASSADHQMPLLPDGDVPDFVLRSVIGRGGQGEVWEAWQSSLQRLVAVKCLRSGDIGEFLQEAYTSGELDHPNIVPVYDLGRVHDGEAERPLLAMKMVQGKPWNDMLEDDRPLRAEKPEVFLTRHLRVLVDVCNAVAYAHSKGIIHRDLKPSQVMVGQFGEVFLMDWGLAVSVHEDVPVVDHESLPKHSTLRTASNRCGSPAYMAPEQTFDSTVGLGIHTDIYLLGAILFEIVSGRPPHAAETAEGAYFMAVLNETGELPEECPSDLRRLIERCLSTEPDVRPASATNFRDTIEDYLSGAGRQRESRELVEAVEKVFETTPLESMDYGHVSQLSQRLSRALQLWPDNFHGELVRQSILARHAELAFQHGDLQLAYSLAGSLADDEQRANMLRGIDHARQRQRMLQRQRRALLYSSFILMALVIVVGSVYSVREARIRADKALKEAEVATQAARRDLYMQRAEEALRMVEEAEGRAELVQEALAMLEEEGDLSRKMAHALPLPATLMPEDDATTRTLARNTEVRDLLRQRAKLAALRADLKLQGLELPEEPVELVMAEAANMLSIASQTSDLRHAYELYKQANDRHPNLPEPLIGMGIAAARQRNARQAAEHLERAATNARLLFGADSLEHAKALSMQAEAVGLGGANTEHQKALRQQALDILQARWRTLSGLLAEQNRSLGREEEAERLESLLR